MNDITILQNYVRIIVIPTSIFETYLNTSCNVHNIKINQLSIKLLNSISMSLLSVLLVIIIVGVLLWLVNTYIPMDHKIKNILNIVVVIFIVIWLLKVFGLFSYLMGIQV